MIRWAEFSLESLISRTDTKFGLVFHTEGLVNKRIVHALKRFGMENATAFRPLLTTITPRCPMYQVDPISDPRRLEFQKKEPSQNMEKEFAENLHDLAERYDIGYHGHFFTLVGERYRPTFEPEEIRPQLIEECAYLRSVGHQPRAYAGGWWHISPKLIGLLGENGFVLDTTLNDLREDSFSRKQPFAASPLAEPFWASPLVLEIPSIRSIRNLLGVAAMRRKAPRLAVIALHDYDLPTGALGGLVTRLFGRLVKAERVASVPEMFELSKAWLERKVGPPDGEKPAAMLRGDGQ